MENTSWQYIAGFFDGEGFLYEPKGYGSHSLGIVNSNFSVLVAIQNFTGVGEVYNKKQRKSIFQYRVFGRARINYFLRNVLPYLVVKRRVVEEYLTRYCILNPPTSFEPTRRYKFKKRLSTGLVS